MKVTTALRYLLLAGLAIFYIVHKFETQSWTKTTARVERTELFSESGPDHFPLYRVTLYYSYDVDGLRYKGLSTSSGSKWESSARRTAQNYPTGKSIAIIYNPEAPDSSEIKELGWSGSVQL
jgi:hypothetical protein